MERCESLKLGPPLSLRSRAHPLAGTCHSTCQSTLITCGLPLSPFCRALLPTAVPGVSFYPCRPSRLQSKVPNSWLRALRRKGMTAPAGQTLSITFFGCVRDSDLCKLCIPTQPNTWCMLLLQPVYRWNVLTSQGIKLSVFLLVGRLQMNIEFLTAHLLRPAVVYQASGS
ncbi:hypothetical protein BDV09DRAFT_119166 [Aspergillus tetrazonus]